MIKTKIYSLLMIVIACFSLIACNNKKTKEYKVTIEDTNLGTVLVKEGEKLNITLPSKTGYTLSGWQANNQPFDINSTINQDITIKPVWVINQYQVVYNTDGGSTINSETYDYNSLINVPENPTKAYNTFLYWEKDGVRFNFTEPVTTNITLKAVWSAIEYEISFDSDGGSMVNLVKYHYGDEIEELPIPTKNYYRFVGWYYNNEEFNLTTMPASDLTLKAGWEQTHYTIKFDSDGGNTLNDQIIKVDTVLSLPTPVKEEYTFLGWMYLGEIFTNQNMPNHDLELVAKWQIKTYTITFDSKGGTSVPSITEAFNVSISAPLSPTKEEATFLGWYNGNDLFIFDKMPKQNLTLNAKWQMNQYTITFDANGGTSVPSITADYNTSIKEPTKPVREDYRFMGWYNGDTLYEFTTMPKQNLNLKALWQQEYTKYQITYNLDGGKWQKDVPYQNKNEMVNDFIKDCNAFYNTSITAAAFFDASFNCGPLENFFKSTTYQTKWSWLKTYIIEVCRKNKYTGLTYLTDEASDYHNTYLRANIHGFLNSTIKSGWPASYDFTNDSDYTSFYDALPGTSVKVIYEYTFVSEDIIIPLVTKSYTEFDGWYDQAGNKVDKITKGSRGDLVLTAHWKVKNYTITYELNGGNGDDLIQSYNPTITSRLYLVKPLKDGYAFMGYYKNTDFTGGEVLYIEPGTTGDLKLYAKWAKEQLGDNYTISFYGDSISTFENYIPQDATFYYPIYSSTVKKAELTWWKLAMEKTGTTLFSNISYSGSTVKGTNATCGETQARINKIAVNGQAPDIIIIYLGVNDAVNHTSASDFETSYRNMVTKMKATYQNADIFVCTLPYETYTDGSNPNGYNYPGLRESYNPIIKNIALQNNLQVIDLEPLITKQTEIYGVKNTYLGDNIHPNAAGMAVISDEVTKVLKAYYQN